MHKKRRGKIILIKGVDPRASIVDKLKHVSREFRKNYRDTYWWKRTISRYIFGFYYRNIRGNAGIYVVEEEWDNLIILDACRHDMLTEVMDGDIGYRISRGSTTLEWLRENFTDEKYDDIVYVTANPWVNKVAGNSFHTIMSVWKDGWDENLGTVHPKTTTEYAKKAAKEYPDKRLIVHYMQPHGPFIVERGLADKAMRELERGNLDLQVVWDIYKRNLEATLPYVFELIDSLEGRTVISADHGELFGRKILFLTFTGHPWGIRVPELIKVPWVVFEGKEKKGIREEDEQQRLRQRIEQLRVKGRI